MRLVRRPSRRPGAVMAFAALTPVLAACTGGEEVAYGAYINQWVGKPVGQLTADWGPASYETTERGQRELQYNFSEAISWGERPIRIGCSTKFLVDGAGTVTLAEASGDACSTRNQGPKSRGG